jgi:hypothetical protein
MYLTLSLAGILFLPQSRGEVEITSFTGDGVITWTQGTNTISSYTVEWASSLDGPWSNSWDSLADIAPTNTQMSAPVPLYYRVVGKQTPTGTNKVGHLFLSEVVVTTTDAEFVEIYNNTGTNQPLDNVYLADYNTYYMITEGSGSPSVTDFRVRFPSGTEIADQARIVVSLHSATNFHSVYASYPDFDLDAADINAPAMEGEIGASRSLSNGGEMLVLFFWDGVDNRVYDIDYLLWGSTTHAMDKTGVGTYLNDTAAASQDYGTAPAVDKSLVRTDMSEGTETKTFGNGVSGHDETSENFSTTWEVSDTPSPASAVTPKRRFRRRP